DLCRCVFVSSLRKLNKGLFCEQKASLVAMFPKRRRSRKHDVMSALNVTIAAINVAKNLVPFELGRGILSTVSTMLDMIKVSVHSYEHPLSRMLTFSSHRTRSRTRRISTTSSITA